MLEIKEKLENKVPNADYNFELLNNGKIVETVKVQRYSFEDDLQLFKLITNSQFVRENKAKNVPDDVVEVEFPWKWEGIFDLNIRVGLGYSAILLFPTFGQDKIWNIEFQIYTDLSDWKHQYSFSEFKEIFLENLPNLEKLVGVEKEFDFVDVSMGNYELYLATFHKFSNNKNMADELLPYIKTLEKYCNDIKSQIEKRMNQNLLITIFDFPNNLKNTCEQYLLYFAQFLQDLGINATSNLKEEAGKVLFSVTPTDEKQALDKIREALAVYLKLPESPIIFDDSFAAMRLQQQIENLQHSQRMAARELQFSEKLLAAQSDMLHEKNLTISQLQSVNEQQQKIIEKISSKSIMMDSVESKEELEEIYDGIKVGESESLKKWLGISLNPAKAIKTAVKNTLGKEDKKSVLGLDEE